MVLGVVLVAVTLAMVAALALDPSLFWWVLVLVLFIGVPVGADLAKVAERRTRMRIKVRHVCDPGS
ncbi:hypothetical protein CFP65_3310 [Kitasatospora sp. MMS16-BH015]|uniref:hypothetical protein n=1 Tax=Kitasatospora sp. MMS16-BH015 TaxID=2018025 RepID=UPI000CA3B12F|nr:hypothetical protein [Kitasatospora sp. MMS16-BH015]AUG78110.1 hypothetical protein CFP65_3310 [Kitasatospora sp. MMS16-BH015]